MDIVRRTARGPDGSPRVQRSNNNGLSQGQREVAVREPDLLLDVPVLTAEELDLDVEGLKARVWVAAELGDLLKLSTGADVNLDKAKLTATDLDVQALVEVRLAEVRAILMKALTTIGEHPEVLLAGPDTGAGQELRQAGQATSQGIGETTKASPF